MTVVYYKIACEVCAQNKEQTQEPDTRFLNNEPLTVCKDCAKKIDDLMEPQRKKQEEEDEKLAAAMRERLAAEAAAKEEEERKKNAAPAAGMEVLAAALAQMATGLTTIAQQNQEILGLLVKQNDEGAEKPAKPRRTR